MREVEGETYAVSRGLFRRLSPYVAGVKESDRRLGRQRLLDACEFTMRRIETEPDFARPDRFLFETVRSCFPISELLWVRKMIELHTRLARQLVERVVIVRQCEAFTRAGAQCQREPVGEGRFCPSHRHLEAVEERARQGAR